MIATIAKKKKVQRSYGNHSPAIAATTIAEIELFTSQRLLSLRSLRSLESGFIWSLWSPRSLKFFFFFFSAIAAITVMGAIMWKPGFNLIMAYFKRKNCLQRNLYLNCVSLWKSLNIVWSVSISAVIWSSLLISVTWVELLWAVYKFFRINNIVPKISQVMMKRRPEVHISIDLQLCRFTLWHNGRRNFWKMNVLKDSANTDR